MQGKLTGYAMSDQEITASLKSLEGLPKPQV